MEFKVTKLAKIIPFKEFSENLKELKMRKEEMWKFFLNRKLKMENNYKCKYYNDIIYKNLRNELTDEEKLQHENEAVKLIKTFYKPDNTNLESVYKYSLNPENLIKKETKVIPDRATSPKKNNIAKILNNFKENLSKNEVFEMTKTQFKKDGHKSSQKSVKMSQSKLIQYKINTSNKNLVTENKTAASTNILFTDPSQVQSGIHTFNPSNNFVEYVRKSVQMKKKRAEVNLEKRLKITIDNWNSTKNSKYYDSGNYDIPLLCMTMK
jgi:hypothetical protein